MLSFMPSLISRTKNLSTMPRNSSTSPIDKLRSTRARIAKPISAAKTPAAACSQPVDSDPTTRDFSNYLGASHPLRIIFVGHNPSEVSWARSAPYAHTTNRFWRLLKEAELAPDHLCKPECFESLPQAAGIGFIDLFVSSGSDASKVGRGAEKQSAWRAEFLSRLEKGTQGDPPDVLCCLSKIVAKKLLGGWDGDYGCIGKGKDWSLDAAGSSEIWVLPSTSGRAGIKWEQRLGPFQRLRARFPDQSEAS